MVILPGIMMANFELHTKDLVIKQMKYGNDPSISIDQIDITQPFSDSRFSAVPGFDFSIPSGIWDHWVLVEVQNQQNASERFVFDFENWVRVIATELRGSSENKAYQTGHFIPYKERDYPSSNESLFLVEFEANETKQFLIALHSTIDYLQIPANLKFDVYNEKAYVHKRLFHRTLFGMFCGFYLIMLMYNLFIYISTKDRYYIPYLIYLVAVLIVTPHLFGYYVPIFKDWDGYVFVHSKMQFFTSMMIGWSMLLFTAWFLEVKIRYPRIYKLMKVLAVLLIFLPLPSLLGYASINEKISGMLGILTMILILTIAIKSQIDKYPSAVYFLVGYGAFSIGIIIMLCTFLGILPISVQDFYPVNFGSSIEMVFFSLALGNRINLLAKDNEEKQAQIIEQLKDREELQTKLNIELEEKVIERTKEIQSQKEEIESQKELIEKEKEKADALLLNILPGPVARELQNKGSATPRYYERATVLFADLVGFTKQSSGYRPERVISELDYCFRGFDEILEKFGVEKIKTIGDGYMCVGGIPIPSEESAINTVRAAVEMQRFMDHWAEQKKEWNEDPWQIRIGVHTGEVVAGIVGKNKFAYDVWGQTVNTASRIEGVCEPGKVNISEDTYSLIKDHFETEYRGKVQTREKELDMYYVLRPK